MPTSRKYVKGLISVIIPYNLNRGWLGEAIDSVEAQTYKNWELVHASGDRSCAENMNRGVEIARGEYIKKLDEDDMLTPNCLQDLYDGIQGYDWVCANAVNWDMAKNTRTVYKSFIPIMEDMLKINTVHGGTTMYRSEIVHYDESLTTGEEYDLSLRLTAEGYRCNYVNKEVYVYRIHSANKSIQKYIGDVYRKDELNYIRRKYV